MSLLCSGLGSEGLHSSDRQEVHSGDPLGVSGLVRHEERRATPHPAVRDQTGAEHQAAGNSQVCLWT